jgi:hypothetical protein
MKIDDVTGRKYLTELFVDQYFDVGIGGQSEFIVTQTFSAISKIDILYKPVPEIIFVDEVPVDTIILNAGELREGATHDYERDVVNNKITTNYVIPSGAWIKVRVWL